MLGHYRAYRFIASFNTAALQQRMTDYSPPQINQLPARY